MSKSRSVILTPLFALMLAIAFAGPGSAQVGNSAVAKVLYVDSYFGTVASPNTQQAYFYGIVTAVGDSTYLASTTDQYFGTVTVLAFGSGSVTFSVEGTNNTGSGYFTGTMTFNSAGTVTVLYKDYFSGATIYSATLKKLPGYIYIIK